MKIAIKRQGGPRGQRQLRALAGHGGGVSGRVAQRKWGFHQQKMMELGDFTKKTWGCMGI